MTLASTLSTTHLLLYVDPDSYFPQSHSPPSQLIISQLEHKEVVRDSVKTLAKFKVDIISSLSYQQFWAFILL